MASVEASTVCWRYGQMVCTSARMVINVTSISLLFLLPYPTLLQLGPQDMWGHYRYHYSGSELNSSTSNRNHYYGNEDAVARDSSYFFGWLLWFLAFCGVWTRAHIHTHTHTHTLLHTYLHLDLSSMLLPCQLEVPSLCRCALVL